VHERVLKQTRQREQSEMDAVERRKQQLENSKKRWMQSG
jgi:hypothetical protein